MFDFVYALAIPGEMARFGRQYHGLLKSHMVPSEQTVQLVGKPNMLTIESRSGQELERIAPKGRDWYVQPDGVHGHAIMYTHPMAEMQGPSPDGRDWSGYLIFTPYELIDGFENYFSAPYGATANLAFTPDDNGQGLFIDVRYNRVRVYSPMIWRPRITDRELAWKDVSYEHAGTHSYSLMGASLDGRAYYLGRFPTAQAVKNRMNDIIGWESSEKPAVIKIDLSGGILASGEIDVSIASESQLELPESVSGFSYSEDVRDDKATMYRMPNGSCVAPDKEPLIVYEKSGEWEGPNTDGWMVSRVFIEIRSKSVRKSYIGADFSGNNPSYLSFIWESERNTDGDGDLSAEASYILLDGACQPQYEGDDKTSRVVDVDSHFEKNEQQVRNDIDRARLLGYGEESVFTHHWQRSDTYSEVKISGNEDIVTSDSQTNVTVDLDGKVFFSASGITRFDDTVLTPARKAFYGTADEGHIETYRYVESPPEGVTDLTGKRFAIISVALHNFLHADLSALRVTVSQGTLLSTSNSRVYAVQDGTYSRQVHFGKTFAPGTVDERTYSFDMAGDGRVFIYRAYDPVDKKISDIYPYPIAYV